MCLKTPWLKNPRERAKRPGSGEEPYGSEIFFAVLLTQSSGVAEWQRLWELGALLQPKASRRVGHMELVRVVFALRATTEAGVRVGRLAPTSVCRRAFAFKTSSYALRAAEDGSSCAKSRLHPCPSGLTRYARHRRPRSRHTECPLRGLHRRESPSRPILLPIGRRQFANAFRVIPCRLEKPLPWSRASAVAPTSLCSL